MRRMIAAVGVLSVLLAVTVEPAGAAAPGQWWLAKYGITKAARLTSGAGVTVAVLDTGVVTRGIGDLAGRVLPGTDLTGSGGANVDRGEGCESRGGCYSHGTQMALLVAGTGRGAGFRGAAPGAKILPVKVGSRTGVSDIQTGSVASGVRYAVDHGAKVISMALGSQRTCTAPEVTAMRYAFEKDVIVLAAAGNEGGTTVDAPATCPGVIAIGGENEDDSPLAKTNSGPEVAFAQASGGVQETLNGTILSGGTGDDGKGTSDATAIAAGCFALLRARFPSESARRIVSRVIAHPYADAKVPIGQREGNQTGYGVVLPYNAMTKPTASNSPNPIYDRFATQFGPAGGSSAPNSTAPASAPNSTAPASASPANSTAPASASPASGGSHVGLVVGVVAAGVLVLVALVFLLTRRSRRQAVPPPPPWAGGPGPPQYRP